MSSVAGTPQPAKPNSTFSHQEGFESGQADFRLLVDSIPDYAIFMLDPHGNILNWSVAARRLFGYDPQEIIGTSAAAFYVESPSPESRNQAETKLKLELQTARDAGRYEEEGWRYRKDGTRFWANAVLIPLHGSDGSLRGYGKVTRDLTERKQAEERYRLLVDSVRDYGIFMLDQNGFIQSWNSGARLIKGYEPQEIIGKHFSTFYTEADIKRNHPARELEIANEIGRFEEEGWRVKKDGSQFWANVLITALKNELGQVIGYAKVTRDLTERMKSERALRESEEKFRTMIAGVRDYAIIMLDPEGNIASWNVGAQRIKGWTEHEIVGKSFKTFYLKEDLAAGKPEMELEVAARDGGFEDFGWRIRKDGTRFWANVVITALRDEKGNLKGFSKVTRDITERKRAEEELKKAYEELEAFSYSVSHDLRAPLRSMNGFADIIEELLGERIDNNIRDYLRRIKDSSKKMSMLIDDLLNLSRLGRAPLQLQSVDLSEIADSVAFELSKTDVNRRVEFKIEQGILVHGDPSLLRIVMSNLIGNAWKYTSKRESARIEFGRVKNMWDEETYFVRDNGAGFDMQYAGKLFGAFQRLHSISEFPGNGIGLATIKRIIHKHGGVIRAEGKPDHGACFFFTLGPSVKAV